MMSSHYAPRARLRLDIHEVRPGEALLAFGPTVPTSSNRMCNLSPRGDLAEAAANLFAMLRQLDQPGVSTIAVMRVPDRGLGRSHQRPPAPRGRPARGRPMSVLDPAIARALKEAAGQDGWSESASEIAPHLVELRGRWKGETPLLLKPASTEAVSRILALCNESGTAHRASGREHRARRRTDPDTRRSAALARTHDAHPHGVARRRSADRRSRRRAQARAASGRRGRTLVSSEPWR